ncbi:MAG: hypothetical protein JRH03_16320 [Deltaproteobacteria bacterium]|nr:hypothetical protein [Deltaproteobacteria bacterium]
MDIEYRHRKIRCYPWWVKTVDRITTETDEARHSKPKMNLLMHNAFVEGEQSQAAIEQSKEVVAGMVRETAQKFPKLRKTFIKGDELFYDQKPKPGPKWLDEKVDFSWAEE